MQTSTTNCKKAVEANTAVNASKTPETLETAPAPPLAIPGLCWNHGTVEQEIHDRNDHCPTGWHSPKPGTNAQ